MCPCLGIHMVLKKDGHVEENGFMFTWAGNEGGREADEILSCLYAFLLEKYLRGDKLIAGLIHVKDKI